MSVSPRKVDITLYSSYNLNIRNSTPKKFYFCILLVLSFLSFLPFPYMRQLSHIPLKTPSNIMEATQKVTQEIKTTVNNLVQKPYRKKDSIPLPIISRPPKNYSNLKFSLDLARDSIKTEDLPSWFRER